MAMLEVKDLAVYYGMIHAIKGVSFEVNKGEIIALIGANGAGKTTILHTITGLLSPKRGSIQFEGKELTKIPAHKIVSLGMAHVPEGRRVFAELSVYQNLKLGAYTRSDKKEIEETMETVYRAFSKTSGKKEPDGRHPFRRRAADAGHGTCLDVSSPDYSDGRAVHGAVTHSGK